MNRVSPIHTYRPHLQRYILPSLQGRGRGVGLLLSLFFFICPAFAESDTLLSILREELTADFSELQKQELKPYFMSFRVQESWNAQITATFGYLGASRQEHIRTFTPQIRVGTPELDNFKFNNQSGAMAINLPLTDASPDAIRSSIWLAMIDTYDRVANAYRNVQSRLRSAADNEDKAPCFSMLSDSVAESYYEPPLTHPALTPAEQRKWEERLCRISSVFRQWPQFKEAIVTLEMKNQRTHLVNTEGTAIVQNRVSYRVFINVEAKTDDGMVLPITQTYYATALDSLPDEATMHRDAEGLGHRLVALMQAPVADPFTGPALMSGPASGVFFHEIFGHRLEGHRMKSGGQTFRKMVGEQVLPTDFQVYCDPTLTHYGKQPLNGGYRYDDEGTPARRVDNVVDGILKEFLMSRTPLDSFPQSNGHGRTAEGGDPVSRQSNLIVETRRPYTEAQLRQMLRDEARRQGKDYGYLFQSVSGGYTQTGEGNSINSLKVNPLEVYRIYVDGRPDELVRGVDLIGTPLSMFSNITAGGDTPSTFIGVCGAESGWVPVSATSPMVFCTKIETQRRQQKGALMPILQAPRPTPNPSRKGGEPSGLTKDDSAQPLPSLTGGVGGWVFVALSAELQRSMDSLRIEGQPAPFLIDYRLQRSRRLNLTARLGAMVEDDLTPWLQRFEAEVLVGNHHRNNSANRTFGGISSAIPMAADYDNLRRAAWFATDAAYKSAITVMESMTRQREKVTLPADEAALPDLLPAKAMKSIVQRSPEAEDLHLDELRAYVRRLSLVAQEFPELTYSFCRIEGNQTDMYRLTSEGVQVAQPVGDKLELLFTFQVYHRPSGGNTFSTHSQEYGTAAELLSDSVSFTRELRRYIRERMALHQQPAEEDYYVGPVLVEGGASKMLFTCVQNNTIMASHDPMLSDRQVLAKMNHKILDEKITIRQDPSLSTWNGQPLRGYYTADANGQPMQAVTLIDHGFFRGQLCGRVPSLCTSASTGNLRFSGARMNSLGVQTCPGVIRLESSKTQSLKKMRKQLLQAARREGYDHAYIIRPMGYYRINIQDGTETLVNMANLYPTTYQQRNIIALSTEEEVATGYVNFTPFSIVGPKAMLLNDQEVPARTADLTAKPVLTYPNKR